MNNLIVGGTFDAAGGRPSVIVSQLHTELGDGWRMMNGGTLAALKECALTAVGDDHLGWLIWMPNISNDEEKILPLFLKSNPDLQLIQSKRVVEKSYTVRDIQARLQASGAKLCIMITQENDRYVFSLVDRNGQVLETTPDISQLGSVLKNPALLL